VLNLNVSTFHGCRPHRRQIRATLAKLISRRSPSSRADQCVTPSDAGAATSVAATTALWSCTTGRPERGKSPNASRPPPAYRARQDLTVGRLRSLNAPRQSRGEGAKDEAGASPSHRSPAGVDRRHVTGTSGSPTSG